VPDATGFAAGQGDDAAMARVLEEISACIREAVAAGSPLQLVGGGTKSFLNKGPGAPVLSLAGYRGVISYQPSELVIEVRAGTPLVDIENLLAEHGQMLAFEPPRFGPASTIGGVVSAGLSGPARPYAGAVRDHVLGVGLLDAAGSVLRFGGRVMKNVAGYDVSRLVAGAWGTLGPLVEIAVRVMPRPARTISVAWAADAAFALARMNELARQTWPLAGACFDGSRLHLRLAGTRAAVDAAVDALRPESTEDGLEFWDALRDFRLPFFGGERPLWRLAVPPAAGLAALPGESLVDWGGAQRWLKTEARPADIQAAARRAGGYAQPFFAADAAQFAPLSATQTVLQARIRAAFGPAGLFNPGCARVGF
jgi:glycolate oxidase FAD binding subunit